MMILGFIHDSISPYSFHYIGLILMSKKLSNVFVTIMKCINLTIYSIFLGLRKVVIRNKLEIGCWLHDILHGSSSIGLENRGFGGTQDLALPIHAKNFIHRWQRREERVFKSKDYR